MSTAHTELSPLDAPASLVAPSSGPARLGPIGPALVIVLLALSALLFVVSLQAYLYAPFSDVHDWIAQVFALERSHDGLGYLWTPHTAERIPWARATEWLDVELVRGRAPSFLIVGAAAWLAGCTPLAVLVLRSAMPRATRIMVLLLGVLLATQVSLAEDFAFPVFSVYLMAAGPALGAITLLHLGSPNGLRSPTFWGAVALAMAASGGNAAGLAVWPALVITAALRRRSREQFFALVVCTALCIAVVESGLGAPSQSLGRDSGSAGAHLVKMAVYFLHFIGLPWTQETHEGPALAIGLAVLAMTLRVASTTGKWRGDDPAPQLSGTALALIVFGLVTAVMATVGRVDELAVAIVPTRYTPFATLLQLGVLLGLACGGGLRATTWSAVLVTVTLGLGIFTSDLHDTRSLHRTSRRIQAAGDAFDRDGVATHDRIVIHPRPAFAAAIRRELAARGLPH